MMNPAWRQYTPFTARDYIGAQRNSIMISTNRSPDHVKKVLSIAKHRFVQRDPTQKTDPVRQGRNSPQVLSVIKNEMDQLPHFLAHYRALGVTCFRFIDNGSRDGSNELLRKQPDVALYHAQQPFNHESKQGWIQQIISETGRRRWNLVVDADEYVVFDGMECHSLEQLCVLLEARGHRRARGALVDIYARGPVLEPPRDNDTPPLQRFDHFDGDNYEQIQRPRMVSLRGGPRPRALSAPELDPLSPELTKYPLFRPGRRDVMANPHHLYPYQENFTAPNVLGLMHAKFMPGLMDKIRDALAQGQYWKNSLEYRHYHTVLEQTPELSLWYEGSQRYTGPESLVSAGIIEAITWNPEA